jgi:hypothetical protein
MTTATERDVGRGGPNLSPRGWPLTTRVPSREDGSDRVESSTIAPITWPEPWEAKRTMPSTQLEAMKNLYRSWTEAPTTYPDRSPEAQRHDLEHRGDLTIASSRSSPATRSRPETRSIRRPSPTLPLWAERHGEARSGYERAIELSRSRVDQASYRRRIELSKFVRAACGFARRRSSPGRSSVTTQEDRPCRTW